MLQTFLNGVQAPLVILVGGLAIVGIIALRKYYKDKKNKRKK